MDNASGIELSVLEGMDEDLLARLHRAGLRSREDLAAALADRAARRRLAGTLGVAEERLEILELLNFHPPEEQARRLLAVERRLHEQAGLLARENRRRWRWTAGIVVLAALCAGFAIAALLLRPGGGAGSGGAGRSGEPAPEELTARVERLEEDLAAVRPLAAAQVENDLLEALARLGPAPGWNGPLAWGAADHFRAASLLGDEDAVLPVRAVSLVLARLAELENAPLDSLAPLNRAREAAALLEDFPPLNGMAGAWDAAAVLLRQRIRSRALGLSPPDPGNPPPFAAEPWPWTAPGFLTAEELVIRLESLPLEERSLPVWSESLAGLRLAADRGRESLAGRPEASARDYWIRRGELELAVAGALLRRDDLLPYHGRSPREFILQRRGFLERAEEAAAPEARAALAWLLVEHDEALALLDWLDGAPGRAGDAAGKRWAAALALVEAARETGGRPPEPDPALAARVSHALRRSGFAEVADPWLHPRTGWEAGLRPLLAATRSARRARLAGVPSSP